MLIRFEAENLFSFAQAQELSLVASKLKDHEDGLRLIPGTSGLRAVPAALIYGANASGKSNLISAFMFMTCAILFSHSRWSPDDGVPRVPFALDDESNDGLSRCEVEFVVDDRRYVFGFTFDNHSFITEWLYDFPEGKRRKQYERESNEVEFGQSMRGAKKHLVEFMRPNSLFISTATQNDHIELSKIVGFFRSIQFCDTLAVSPATVGRMFTDGRVDVRTIAFLRDTGTGVVGQEQREKKLPERLTKLGSRLREVFREQLGDEYADGLHIGDNGAEMMLRHQGSKKEYTLPLRRESAGTLRLLVLMGEVLSALDKGTVLIIDELDTSLHTLVAEQIVELFSDPRHNPRGAQLIATTHDTNVLACKHLRRDQVWFCEKDDAGASHVFSLAEFKLRSKDNFERGYLEGRFGAIPFAGNLGALLEAKAS